MKLVSWCCRLSPVLKRPLTLACLCFALWLVLRHSFQPLLPLSTLGVVPTRPATNWGDYVAFGHARQTLLNHSDPRYPGLGDRHLTYAFPRSRLRSTGDTPPGATGGAARLLDARKGAIEAGSAFAKERHGRYGGKATDWSTGLPGMGLHLGPLDMRKRTQDSAREAPRLQDDQQATIKHYLSNAWLTPDEREAKHRTWVLNLPPAERAAHNLPLRDQAAGIPSAERGLASLWMHIYSGYGGEGSKSALEVAVEEMVLRVPVVVFTEDNDESARVRALLDRKRLSPEVLFVPVDKRPDAKNLNSLLKRLTLHGGLPNVIVGGRCLGGLSDLSTLEEDGTLNRILNDAGAIAHGPPY